MPIVLRRIERAMERPEEDLALDEALLRVLDAELERGADPSSGFLRFWESARHFVALGVSSKLREDVDAERCAEDGVPVLRRASGGGTVLQGPGCLNVSLVVSLDARAGLRDVTRSYRWVLKRAIEALGLAGARRRGISDLALGERKFAGSAQKRTPRALLHHSSILWDFDLELVSRYLREPAKRPDYRGTRAHAEFLMNCPLDAAEIRRRLATAWGPSAAAPAWEPPPLDAYIDERYGRREWNERF